MGRVSITLQAEALRSSYLGRSRGLCSQGRYQSSYFKKWWINCSNISKSYRSIVPRGLYGSSSSFSSGPLRLLCWCGSWQCLCRVTLLRPFLFFFVFFAVEVLFLLPSNKKTKVKKKIKAKKTNSASENAITSVLFTYHETSFMKWSHLHGKWVKKLKVLKKNN